MGPFRLSSPSRRAWPVVLFVLASVCGSTASAAEEDPDAGYTVRLYLAKSDGSEPRPLLQAPELTSQGSPSWSRDGRLIAFDGWRKPSDGRAASIYVVNRDGSNLRRLTDGAMPALSPQGHRVAFSRYALGHGIWIANTAAPETELVQIDETGWGTDWSPDGTRVAFTKAGPNGANIMVFNIVEGTRQPVFAGESPYRQIYWNFAWSPDSRSIAFKGMRRDGKAELAVVQEDGRGLKTVAMADTLPAVSFFPDGRLVFSQPWPERNNLPQLFTVDVAKEGLPQHLSQLPEGFSYQDTCPSPDGEFLLYLRKPAPPAAPAAPPKAAP